MKLSELAKTLNLPFQGDANYPINSVGDLEHTSPADPNSIYFVSSKKYLNKFEKAQKAKVVLTIDSLKDQYANAIIAPDKDTKVSFIQLLGLFEKKPVYKQQISPKASVADTAKIGKNVTIMDFAVIMDDVEIGDNCVIFPHVVIEDRAKIGANTVIKGGVQICYECVIGSNNLIHGNTVIGADGFGFHDANGIRYKIPQIGNVIIGDHVEIGAGCTIDRAAIESTTIGNYTKLDDQVHIGHNCRLGNYIYLAGTAGLAGSVTAEDYVIVGGQAAVAEHLTLKKGSIVMGLTGQTSDAEAKTAYFGIPGRPAIEMHRIHNAMSSLPEMVREWKKAKKNESE
ncbi:UDP-3-O-(3-hydroxymyristoyl)glucosamine N-acyltransferase [Leptospira sp. GIMC2001]|uniref:UDP-3-O-(3-hydroxymyristoyl)glucosamine N-acyltransferase n=1 Tax=Leptospira sp. GIMC2001 TaxID=1513297 RepID=UPI00234B7417|nr:UDP-3-O-(3-hydroxymyristoyl)glucosamine N-acyltransferase [Leptospira sp. GIMC2001]WCL49144.1 UDP-3-O-(3-hydroxymyristoyl)glucosamine N-acyltransferase [Leptospira sp. GIMC2001]